MPAYQQASQRRPAARGGHRKSFHGPAGDALHRPTELDPGIAQRARLAPTALSAGDVLHLQRTIGNQAVGRLLSAGAAGQLHRPPHVLVTARPIQRIQRKLILNGQEIGKAEDVQTELGADFAAMQQTVQELIGLPGLPVKVNTAQLKEVHGFRTKQQVPTSREAKVATLQLLSHGAWTHTATVGTKTRLTLDVFNTPSALANLGKLGTFLETNPNVGKNLEGAGVGWELKSNHQFISGFGGGAVIQDRIHIEDWVLSEKGEGFMRMVVHEAGHATFQRMLLTGQNWSDEADRGEKAPDDKALEADGKQFYEAWQVIRAKPQYFFITDMPGGAAEATGAGRGNYLAGKFSEFCAESFMHLALMKAQLQRHVRTLPRNEGAVLAAWQSALGVLLRNESKILGRGQEGGKETLERHRRTQQFMTALQGLQKGLNGPNLEVADLDVVKKNLEGLKRAWQGMALAERTQHRSDALTILDDYIMRVQRRRPAQEHLGSELGFANL